MKTFQINNESILAGVIRILRGEGCRAWSEKNDGQTVLCTDARQSLVAMCSGDGLWAQPLFAGLPQVQRNLL